MGIRTIVLVMLAAVIPAAAHGQVAPAPSQVMPPIIMPPAPPTEFGVEPRRESGATKRTSKEQRQKTKKKKSRSR